MSITNSPNTETPTNPLSRELVVVESATMARYSAIWMNGSMSLLFNYTQDSPSYLHRLGRSPPDVTAFYGRQSELHTLTQWAVDDGCRLIGVLGMGRIGKTTLTAKFIETLETANCPFTHIIWRSLHNGPPST